MAEAGGAGSARRIPGRARNSRPSPRAVSAAVARTTRPKQACPGPEPAAPPYSAPRSRRTAFNLWLHGGRRLGRPVCLSTVHGEQDFFSLADLKGAQASSCSPSPHLRLCPGVTYAAQVPRPRRETVQSLRLQHALRPPAETRLPLPSPGVGSAAPPALRWAPGPSLHPALRSRLPSAVGIVLSSCPTLRFPTQPSASSTDSSSASSRLLDLLMGASRLDALTLHPDPALGLLPPLKRPNVTSHACPRADGTLFAGH